MKIIIFFTQCKSKENRKLLREYAAELGRNVLADLRKRQNIDFPNPPVLINEDTGKSFKVQMTGINEIKNHDIFLEGHIETISNLEDIITKSIYICSEENEDNRKPNLKKFHYFAAGIQFNDEDFTVKAVFTENDTGEIFYDQSLSTVEKGKLVEILSEKNKLNNLNPIISQEIIELLEEDDKSTSGNYDKRLITICQVPQLPYLDEKLIPTKETVRLVKEGKLRCVKKGQTYSIETHADVEKNKLKASSPQKKAKDSFEPSQEDNNLSPLITQREVNSSYVYYDKRLINICQVPQLPYLDEKLIPTKETVRLVKEGKLRCVKKGQTYSIETHADVEKNKLKASSPQKINDFKIENPDQPMSASDEISEQEIDQEKYLIQRKIKSIEDEINNNRNDFYENEADLIEAQSYIERLRNLTDDDIKKIVSWKKNNEIENIKNHNSVKEQINQEMLERSKPEKDGLFSYDDLHPIITIENKETKNRTAIQPSGIKAHNIKQVGKLKTLSESNEVIAKIEALGFEILSTESRILIHNKNVYYDFDTYSEFNSFNGSKKLNEWDFINFIKNDFKLTKEMKSFAAAPIDDNPLARQNSNSYTNKILDKIRSAGIDVVTDRDEFNRILEQEDVLQKMANDEIIRNPAQNDNVSMDIRNIICDSMKQSASKFVPVVYSRENYNKIFRDGYIESPIETVKLGQNQFIKLSPGNRNNLMLAIRQTIENPSIILEKETFDENSESFKPVHVYGKSFVNESNEHIKTVESIIVYKEGDNIAISLHNKLVEDFIRQIKTTNDIVYLDDEVSRVAMFAAKSGDGHVLKETEQLLSRVRQMSYSSLGQESYPLNPRYNKDGIMSTVDFISSHGIETGKLEINKDNFDRYFNILNQHKDFKDNRNKIASELFNYHVPSENKEEMKNWLSDQGYVVNEKNVTQFMTLNNGLTYGFVHDGKIYLNPEIMNSNSAVHEYTHLWDAYTRKTNPELWNKGLEIFRDTNYWNEVISDPNYQDIKDDENLVLSEIHSRICGDMAEKVLDRISKLDGEQAKLDAIDWDKETWTYVFNELNVDLKHAFDSSGELSFLDLKEFLFTPMKNLMTEKNINIEINQEKKSMEQSKKIMDHKESESKPYSFFVDDAANLDLGIGVEFEPVTGMDAEQAVLKYSELKEKGLNPYIGLCIPGDFIFNDNYGNGVGIFTETGGKPSFDIGDTFVNGLKENDEHAKTVIAAYKELYENADKFIRGVEKPDFVFDKEAEIFDEELDNLKFSADVDELTQRDIELCRKVIPPSQFNLTMELSDGEEGEFFKNRMRKIADIYRTINTDSELTNDDGTHNLGFRYFLGDTEIYISEIDLHGNGFGYTILNGDLPMSEFGYTSMDELLSIPGIEMDYNVPEGITIERMLYQKHPEYFSKYAPKEESVEQEKNDSSYANEILDKIRAAGINVEISAEKMQEILNLRKDINKMVVDIQEFEEKKTEIEKIRTYNSILSDENKSLVREQEFVDFQTSLVACKKFIEDLPGCKLPDIKWPENEDSSFVLTIQKKNEHLVLTTLNDTLVYDFETKEIGNDYLFNAFKDFNAENNCCDILVKTINDNLGKQLGEQRSRLKKLMQENAILSGKALNELSAEETRELKERLKSLDYEQIEGIFIHKDKKIALTPEDYVKEVMNAKLLVDHDHTVYLLPENFAFRRINEKGKYESNSTPDTLTDEEFVELKTTDKKLGARFGEAVEQANNVLIRIEDDISIYNARKRLQNKIKNLPRENGIEVKDGKLFLYFEKKGLYVEAEIKQGKINILPAGPSLADLTESRPANSIISQAEELSSSIPKVSEMIARTGVLAGIAYDNNIILNPDYLSSNAAVHEYTHLWDAYTRTTNPELWNKGLEIFRDTYYWNEVISDPNYQDIKDDENLVLSEIHSRICGDMAEKVLDRISKLDGEQAKLDAIDWDRETWTYVFNELHVDLKHAFDSSGELSFLDLKNFLSTPMKDLMAEKNINIEFQQPRENKMEEQKRNDGKEFNQSANLNTEMEEKPTVGVPFITENGNIFLAPEDSIKGEIEEFSKEVDIDADESGLSPEVQKSDREENLDTPSKSLEVYTFSPVGYEGSIVQVETELKSGIPSHDFIGIADSVAAETRKRIRSAFINSALDFPSERVLQSLSPADFRKDSPMDLSLALGILGQTRQYPVNEPVLVLGELEVSGNIRPVRGAIAAVNTARGLGINNVICDLATAELLKDIHGIKILAAENLKEVNEKLMEVESWSKTFTIEDEQWRQREFIREKMQNTDSWMKTPTGEKTHLTEQLWLDVQTPNFKRNFGNWNYDANQKVNIISLDTEDLPFDYDNTQSLKQWLKTNLVGKSVEIDSDGQNVKFNSRTTKASIKRRGEEQRGAYSVLESLIENSVYFDFEKTDGQNKHNHLKGQDIYYSALKVGEKLYSVRIKVDVSKDNLEGAYKDHKVSEINIAPNLYHSQSNDLYADIEADKISMGHLTDFVKPKKLIELNEVAEPTAKEIKDRLVADESIKNGLTESEKKLFASLFDLDKNEVQFNEEWMEDDYNKEALESLPMDGHFETIRAIEIAVAGKHNILATGAPGCGKTLLTEKLIPALTPKLTEDESKQITRINSLAGLDSPKRDKLVPPFRMPHYIASAEGIFGGGINLRPGEISLAHYGTLFMDEAAEFHSSQLEMLRVPLVTRHITLSRAGRSTSYPADFQLAMTMNPCPCGCYGSPDKICLDSDKSIKQYWEKISNSLLDRVEIKTFVQKDEKDTRKMSIDELKAQIANAYEIQRKRGVYNSHMTPEEIQKYCKLDKEGQAYLDKEEENFTPREKSNILKLSLTIANMDGREEICISDLKEARELSAPVFDKPKQFVYVPNQSANLNAEVEEKPTVGVPFITENGNIFLAPEDSIKGEIEEFSKEVDRDADESGLTPEQKEIRAAQSKLSDIVRGTFLALSDEEKEKGTTIEQQNERYEKWFRPMVDEIMAEIGNGNKEVMAIVQNFDQNLESHVQGNKWYSVYKAHAHDIQYKLLPEMYEKVQDRIKAEYEENKIPYVVLNWSESPKFPSENKVYTVKEFNEILLQADSEFHNRKKYAEEKYGSADNYWNLERDDKLPEEDKGIQFGYDKTNFEFFNIPNPNNPEDPFSYEPSRYDIGDGNGSVFDYVRSTCSHDKFIEALNALETQLYFPGVTEVEKDLVKNIIQEETENLKNNLNEKMKNLDKVQNEYKELHKKWFIEATEADRVDELLKNALDEIKNTYDGAINNVFTRVIDNDPLTVPQNIKDSEFYSYVANEAKKMVVSELHLPSRNAQKAMNADDLKTINSIDWEKLRRIWEKFPANVNMTSYVEKLLQDKCAEKGMSVSENTKAVIPPTFSDEPEIMRDFFDLSKEEFLASYLDIITEEEYDATFNEIIHTEEFISRFGDWEKAQRLEKLKNAESLETDARIILNEEDITDTVVSLIENEDRKSIQSLEKEIGKTVVGKYENRDTGLTFNVSNRNVTEISNHHYLWKEHIKAISLIPQISEKAIFIGEEENEDKKRNPNIVTYKYFAAGVKIDDEDYTCKVVIGVDDSKNCYYDQSLSTIEKGKLIDILQEKNKLEADNFELTKEEDNNLSPLITQREVTSSYIYYDKRLINICQVPQMPYLDEDLKPTLAAVQAVHKGLLYMEKKDQQYVMKSLEDKSAIEVSKNVQPEEKSMEYPESSSQKISWVPLHNGRDTDYTYINGHNIERYFIWENENGENEYSVSIDGEDLCFIDDETNEEHKLFFTESELNKQIINDTLYYGNSVDSIKNSKSKIDNSTPELKTYHTLKKEDVENLHVISDEEFSDIVDSIILNDYKNIPNAIRLPNINETLAEKLGLEKDSAFILKKEATHIRPDRKGGYGQAFDTEEYRMIPAAIRNAEFAIVDRRTKNFMIVFDDKNEASKINKLVFNKDEFGNYLVTVGKVDRRDGLSEKENFVVGVGVAPTISALRFPEELPATRLRPSTTTIDFNVSQTEKKSSGLTPEQKELKWERCLLYSTQDRDGVYRGVYDGRKEYITLELKNKGTVTFVTFYREPLDDKDGTELYSLTRNGIPVQGFEKSTVEKINKHILEYVNHVSNEPRTSNVVSAENKKEDAQETGTLTFEDAVRSLSKEEFLEIYRHISEDEYNTLAARVAKLDKRKVAEKEMVVPLPSNTVDLTDVFDNKLKNQNEIAKYLKSLTDEIFITYDNYKIGITPKDSKHLVYTNGAPYRSQKVRINNYLMNLEKVLSNAEFKGESSAKGKKGVESFYYFTVPIKVGNGLYTVQFDCKKNSDVVIAKEQSPNKLTDNNITGIYNNQILEISQVDCYLYNIKERVVTRELENLKALTPPSQTQEDIEEGHKHARAEAERNQYESKQVKPGQKEEISESIEITIVMNKKYNIPNLSFSNKPTEEMRNEMKAAGWLYNPKENVWWPRTKEAQFHSAEFAENFKHRFEEIELPWDEKLSPGMDKRIDSGETFGTYSANEESPATSTTTEPKEEVKERSQFDRELDDFIQGKLDDSHVFSMGYPGMILRSCGFPDQRIEMSASRLKFKAGRDWHRFDLSDVHGLDESLKNPVAVFEYGDRGKSQNVIVNLKKNGKNFLAGIHFNQIKNGFEISTVRTLFPKDGIEVVNWIDQGKMIYGDKEKILALIAQQRINVADVNNQVMQSPLHERCLDSVDSLMQRFGNVKDIFTDEFEFYRENKERYQIYKRFNGYYTSMGTLGGHEMAREQSEEFYEALKNGDTKTIERYMEEDGEFEISHLAREIVKNLDETERESAETINAVNARYGYKPEFHEIYAQAGAALESLKLRLTPKLPDVNRSDITTEKKPMTLREEASSLVLDIHKSIDTYRSFLQEHSDTVDTSTQLNILDVVDNALSGKTIDRNSDHKNDRQRTRKSDGIEY